jgi:hypothetical protein
MVSAVGISLRHTRAEGPGYRPLVPRPSLRLEPTGHVRKADLVRVVPIAHEPYGCFFRRDFLVAVDRPLPSTDHPWSGRGTRGPTGSPWPARCGSDRPRRLLRRTVQPHPGRTSGQSRQLALVAASLSPSSVNSETSSSPSVASAGASKSDQSEFKMSALERKEHSTLLEGGQALPSQVPVTPRPSITADAEEPEIGVAACSEMLLCQKEQPSDVFDR